MENRLTQEQIEQIDYTLRKQYSFEKFDDVRMELVDHIATDVETEMNQNKILFDDALLKVLIKWKQEISWDRASKYDSVPRIVSTFWKKLDLKYNYSIIPISILISAVLMYFRKQEFIGYITYGMAFIGLSINIYLIRLYRQNKFNTVLSVYASNQIYILFGALIFGIATNIVLNVYDGDMKSMPAQWLIVHATITVVLRTLLMRKNIKIENQLLKVN